MKSDCMIWVGVMDWLLRRTGIVGRMELMGAVVDDTLMLLFLSLVYKLSLGPYWLSVFIIVVSFIYLIFPIHSDLYSMVIKA